MKNLLMIFSFIMVCFVLFNCGDDNNFNFSTTTEIENINSINFIRSGLIKTEELENELFFLKSSKTSFRKESLYRKIENLKTGIITYSLPLSIYSNSNPYYLIQQIVKDDNVVQIRYLKIIPNIEPKDYRTDILKELTGKIELLDEDMQFISSTNYIKGKAIKETSHSTKNEKTSCYFFTEITEVPCTNGGNHGVGESCQQGYTNDAYYIVTYYFICFSDGNWHTQGGGYSSGDMSGGFIFDYQLNQILTNPTFKYSEYITDPSRALLLQALRQWIPNNVSNLNGDLSSLNNVIEVFINNDQMFSDLKVYNDNTNHVPNMEMAEYSIRVYDMLKFLLNHPTQENGMAAKYSVAYLDKNRFISWQDYFITFKGIGKIIAKNPFITKEQFMKWMKWYDRYKFNQPEASNYFNKNPQDLHILFTLWADFLLYNPNIGWNHLVNWFFKQNDIKEYFDEINPELITFDENIQQATLPLLNTYVLNFPKKGIAPNYSEMPTSEVFNLVGGSLLNSHLTQTNSYSNACAIRGSRGLLYSGINIPVLHYNGNQRTQKGADNKNYILDAVSFNKFMINKFGDTPYKLEGADANDPIQIANLLKNKNGIYVIINNKYPSQVSYSGHVDTIIEGKCIGGAYTTPKGGVKSIRIWILN